MDKTTTSRQPSGSSSYDYPSGQEYLLESPHTKEECLKSLDEVKNMGPEVLEQWSWGCSHGNHTGYALVNADNESQAKNDYVPRSMHYKVKITPLEKLTVDQIESYHTMK